MNNVVTNNTSGSNYIRLCDDSDVADFVSIPIKRIDWYNDGTNLAGLYVNQAMYNKNGFVKYFVGELDIISCDKNRVTVQVTKDQVQSLIQALTELNKNL